MDDEKTILGFDVSSSAIGYGVLKIKPDNQIEFVSMDYLKPQKTSNIVDDLFDTRNKIREIIQKIKPTHIAVEELIKFMKGASSANTIIKLTSFNRMVCLEARDFLGQSPKLLSVMTIRHAIKKDRGLDKLPQKEELPDLVSSILSLMFPWEMNKKGNPKVENFDKCDGLCVALRMAWELTGKLEKKKTKKKCP